MCVYHVKSTKDKFKERIEALFHENRQVYGSFIIQIASDFEGLIYFRAYIALLMDKIG